jgi:hypothetical protein
MYRVNGAYYLAKCQSLVIPIPYELRKIKYFNLFEIKIHSIPSNPHGLRVKRKVVFSPLLFGLDANEVKVCLRPDLEVKYLPPN